MQFSFAPSSFSQASFSTPLSTAILLPSQLTTSGYQLALNPQHIRSTQLPASPSTALANPETSVQAIPTTMLTNSSSLTNVSATAADPSVGNSGTSQPSVGNLLDEQFPTAQMPWPPVTPWVSRYPSSEQGAQTATIEFGGTAHLQEIWVFVDSSTPVSANANIQIAAAAPLTLQINGYTWDLPLNHPGWNQLTLSIVSDRLELSYLATSPPITELVIGAKPLVYDDPNPDQDAGYILGD